MRAFLVVLLLIVLVVVVSPVALVVGAVEDSPRLARSVVIGPEQVARAVRIVEGHHPSRMRSGTLASMTLRQDDVDLAANYLVDRFARGSAAVALGADTANVTLSVPLPANPIGAWLNLEAELAATPGLPVVTALRVGKVPLPGFVAAYAGEQLLAWLRTRPEAQAGLEALRGIRFAPTGLTVLYDWSEELPDRVRAGAMPAGQRDRLRAYQERLAALPGGQASLTDLLKPLMAFAAERSGRGDPVAENQAAIVVLTMHVIGKPLALVEPEAAGWPKVAPRPVTLAGRDDFPKHFMVSAALAALAGTALADAVGLYKEIDDSRGGSGFSFNDIAADRAGTRFGERAVDIAGAAALQTRAAAGMRETDILPPTADLPEFMPEAEFKARFGGVDGPGYRRMMEEIERRVAALPL
jgi:hypothetical protein